MIFRKAEMLLLIVFMGIFTMNMKVCAKEETDVLLVDVNTESREEALSIDESEFIYADSGKTMLTAYTGSESVVTIPSTVTMIGQEAFRGNTVLEEVFIPDLVRIIEDNAFSGCTNVSKINGGKGVATIGNFAFSNMDNLQFIDFMVLETIGRGAFLNCLELRNFEFAETLQTVQYGAFSGCIKLEEVVIPDSVVEMQGGIFWGVQI